ncbi:MAG TPA: EamA family transporter [Candidatus Obscuribacterales bacterium]
MSFVATLVWISTLFFDTVGQLAFKAAAVHAGQTDGLQRWLAMARNHWLWVGLLSYVAEILSWLAFLSLVPLSVAVLLGSLNIICVMIGGRIFFQEKLTKRRLLAVTLVALGVVLVGWGGGDL